MQYLHDRAEKRLRMSRNCSEKLGDTRAFSYSFAIELPTSRPIFGKCSRMKLFCSKDMLYLCYRTVYSENSKLNCSTYVSINSIGIPRRVTSFQKFRLFTIVLLWFLCVSPRKFGTRANVFHLCLPALLGWTEIR